MIDPSVGSSDQCVEEKIDQLAGDLEKQLAADVLSFIGPLGYGVDDYVRDAVEWRRAKSVANRKLAVVVGTEGGYVETVDRIVTVFRKHYAEVDFYVPNGGAPMFL